MADFEAKLKKDQEDDKASKVKVGGRRRRLLTPSYYMHLGSLREFTCTYIYTYLPVCGCL